MTIRPLTGVLLAALCAFPAIGRAAEKAPSVNAARFEALKKLAGDWVQLAADGKPGTTIASSIRVTAGGSVVQETLFPGTDHEMVTMYHLDGEALMLTHYCSLQNQPRMRAEPGKDAKQIKFKFTDGTNVLSKDAMRMDEATLTILNDNHIRAVWVSTKEDKPCHTATFELVRKK